MRTGHLLELPLPCRDGIQGTGEVYTWDKFSGSL